MLPISKDECDDRFGLAKLPLLLRVDDLTTALSIGRTHAHFLMSTELDVVKLGRATRITRASVIRMVERSLAIPAEPTTTDIGGVKVAASTFTRLALPFPLLSTDLP